MKRIMQWSLVAALLALLTACGSPSSGEDPYADLDVEPPPPVEDPTITTSGSIGTSSKGEDLMDINVAGFLDPETSGLSTAQVAELSESDFTVVEAGTVKGITVEKIGGDVRAGADVVFVFDTTGSMGSGLDSVQNSIIAFSQFLDDSGLDARVGAVTFGDAYDTVDDVAAPTRGESLRGDTPPSFDGDTRPTFDLSTDFAGFETFIADDSPRGGGDGPENAIGALDYAMQALDWREGAQRIMIVVTDVCSHTNPSFESAFSTSTDWDRWQPRPTSDVLADLRGRASVHVVGPADPFCSTDTVDMATFTGSDGTGGVFVPWDGFSEFDLTELPIAEATSGGYVVTFRGTKDGEPKTVRVVIDDGSDIRGEFSLEATY